MHDEAEFSLARLLAQMDVPEALLVGHSDGASISLLHAASNPDRVSGLVLLAPHVFVEDVSIAGIRASRTAYLAGDLRRRLAKYHRDPDATFFGWNDIWLSAEFRSWNIEDVLSRIDCPVLVAQETNDPYGTLAQVAAIVAQVSGDVAELTIAGSGHAPHLDAPQQMTDAVACFILRALAGRGQQRAQ